jgi:hypothetical protein
MVDAMTVRMRSTVKLRNNLEKAKDFPFVFFEIITHPIGNIFYRYPFFAPAIGFPQERIEDLRPYGPPQVRASGSKIRESGPEQCGKNIDVSS